MQASDFDNVPWVELIMREDFQPTAYELYKQHIQTRELDYTYIKNITVDVDYFLNLPTDTRKLFNPGLGRFRREYSKEFMDAYINTTLEQSDPDYESEPMQQLKQALNLDVIHCIQQTQLPGHMVGEHIDAHRSLARILVDKGLDTKVTRKHIRKYIVMLDDWYTGQAFLCGRHAYMNWRKGDVVTFPWYMPHSTANGGFHPRPLLFVTGVEWNNNLIFN